MSTQAHELPAATIVQLTTLRSMDAFTANIDNCECYTNPRDVEQDFLTDEEIAEMEAHSRRRLGEDFESTDKGFSFALESFGDLCTIYHITYNGVSIFSTEDESEFDDELRITRSLSEEHAKVHWSI